MKNKLTIQQLIETLPGYRIEKSHFKIGSKIHISEFYYAKRFFQNSFFASRFAYLLAKQIIEDADTARLEEFRTNGLTLMGYGMYSELMLTLIHKFIIEIGDLNEKNISHNVILDTVTLEFVKNKPPFNNIIIIVPIASTFSTSLKMEEAVLKKYPDSVIIPEHYNVIHVFGDTDSQDQARLEEEFGWEQKLPDQKAVIVKAFYEKTGTIQRTQKYFLQLPSVWSDQNKCENCIPDDDFKNHAIGQYGKLGDEIPLFETDRTSVTPSMIFNLPKSSVFPADTPAKSFLLSPDMVTYGHSVRNYSHFIYSINTEFFLHENKPSISKWLNTLRESEDFKNKYSDHQNILIVSSCHYSNAEFINLVNEVLFFSSANVIHYDPTNDYIQNFDMIYGQEVYNSDKILFVDDSLKSGKTYQKIDEFIRHTIRIRNLGKETDKKKIAKIDACVFLLNKSQPFTYETVKSSIADETAVHSYVKLHIFTSLSQEEESSLLMEENKYQALTGLSVLSNLQFHFRHQKNKLKQNSNSQVSEKAQLRHLYMLESTHRLYEYLNTLTSIPDFGTFSDFYVTVKESTSFPDTYYEKVNQEERKLLLQNAMLKVLTQVPFTQYEPLKKITFKWVQGLLTTTLELTKKHIETGQFRYDHFQYLKFIIRRATLINCGFVISVPVIDIIRLLYSEKGLASLQKELELEKTKLTEPFKPKAGLYVDEEVKKHELKLKQIETECRSKEENIKDFHIFYCAQVKELCFLNESRAIHLEKLIHYDKARTGVARLNLLNLLKIENVIIILQFYEFISKVEEWGLLAIKPDVPNSFSSDLELIKEFLQIPKICNNHRYKMLMLYFQVNKLNEPAENDSFMAYLWIRHVLENKKTRKDFRLEERTKSLFTALTYICLYPDNTNKNISVDGSFLIVKDNAGEAHITYNRNHNGYEILDSYNWKTEEDSFLSEMLEGYSECSHHYLETIVQLDKKGDKWINSHNINGDKDHVRLSPEFLDSKQDTLILLRLSKWEKEANRSLGLAGFTLSKKGHTESDIIRIQFLALLQSPLTEFIEENHQSSLFHEWKKAESRKRMVLLSSHGREMLQMVADEDPDLKRMAEYQEFLQQISNIYEYMPGVNNESDRKDKFREIIQTGSSSKVTETYIDKIHGYANSIIASPSIECKEDFDLPVQEKKPFEFNLNIRVLEVILFEILVNAKRHRWHFYPGDSIEGFEKNIIKIEMEVTNEEDHKILSLKVSNTCPDPRNNEGDNFLKKLNRAHSSVKKAYESSGTLLIKELISALPGGQVVFDIIPHTQDNNVVMFSVCIKIKEVL